MTTTHAHIARIRTAFANTYLICNGRNSVLIDTGMETPGKTVLQSLSGHGLQPSDIRLIILTHCHYDHARGAAALRAATGAKLLVHEHHAPHLRKGYCRLPKGTNLLIEAWVSMGRAFMPRLAHFPPVEPDVIIDREYGLANLGLDARIIPTPGHTSGSLSVILDGRHAIVGDLVISGRGKSVFPPFADDPATLIRSWKTVIDAGVEYIYPGHGHPFRTEQLNRDFEKRKNKYGY